MAQGLTHRGGEEYALGIDSHVCDHLVYYNDNTAVQWGENVLFKKWGWSIGCCVFKKGGKFKLYFTIYISVVSYCRPKMKYKYETIKL